MDIVNEQGFSASRVVDPCQDRLAECKEGVRMLKVDARQENVLTIGALPADGVDSLLQRDGEGLQILVMWLV